MKIQHKNLKITKLTNIKLNPSYQIILSIYNLII